jgi:ubiquinone/menaquinone biosynthesis C-methylase UbiE
MKVDDSGMPEESYWNSLFDIEAIVEWLAISKKNTTIVEIGSGYGTFTVPAAKKSTGKIFAFDIEPSMIEVARENARKAGLSNVTFSLRDVLEQGTGLEAGSVDMALLFNILHFSEKRALLEEAARILKEGGIVAIIHWRKDIATPRGPALNVRPDQDEILSAVAGLNFNFHGNGKILEPYHWGMQLVKAL